MATYPTKPTKRSQRAPRGPSTLGEVLADAARRFKAAGLAHGHGTSSREAEAAFLILEILKIPFKRLERVIDKPLTTAQLKKAAAAVAERIATRKPAAYLTKRAYIQGIPFHVDERVIVPRSFLGELLFSNAVVGGLVPDASRVKRVLDLCTGSGCLAVLAAEVFPKAKIDAVEISSGALQVAAKNVAASRHRKRISLLQGDLLEPVKGRHYDLIIANPPYVDHAAMGKLPAEYRHEPALAFDGGKDGLDLVRRILDKARDHLTAGGGLLCEIGSGRKRLERAYPDLNFFWLDTAESSGEVFWLEADALPP